MSRARIGRARVGGVLSVLVRACVIGNARDRNVMTLRATAGPMVRTLILSACLAAATLLLAPLAAAEPYIYRAKLPDPTLFPAEGVTVGGFCVLNAACVETYCVETLSKCCPKQPPAIEPDPSILHCSA